MHEIILCKLGEVVLKGLNRRSFEMKLMSNIRRRTQRFGKWKIYSRQSTIYVEPAEDGCDMAGAYAACKQVFGIIAITRALPCEKSKRGVRMVEMKEYVPTLELETEGESVSFAVCLPASQDLNLNPSLLTAALEAKFSVPAATASILRTEFLTADKQKFE